ncbi:MAG: insulinase family protein [Lentisphaeraceae bacterium]|nr:insulinase family protein [Lentisphaeraceae bacterium]
MNRDHGRVYRLESEERVEEIDSDIQIFTHLATGAKVLVAKSEDDNKVFNISFKTPPEDDTGLAHIMEHSVLCGSRKYPVKEPFVELMKGSLNTFLNAMTYPDKTVYPVASRNLKDFQNLVDVYLDAVFFPTLSKEAFEQEGWHYEVEENSLSYKGVVFNEMKGVFSSPESYLDYSLNKVLFADSTYGFESGGFPEAITDLSYETYLQFHKEKYHPANSWITIYGDVDTDYWLDYLENEYLGKFQMPDFKLPEIVKREKLLEPQEIECSYPAGEDTDKNASLISISFITGDILDVERNFAMGVLDAILIGSAASPLKKALLESGLSEDTLDYGYGNEILQTSWSVGLRDASPENKQAFVDLVFSEFRKYAKEGLPEKMVKAALNTCEFQLREANYGSYPKGLIYSFNIMNQWLYEGNPTTGLKFEDLLSDLKTKVAQGGYFEKLIEDVFLNNSEYVVAVCKPDSEMGLKEQQEEANKLAAYEKTLSDEDKLALKARNEYLLELQSTPDSEEALASIPHVSKEDIDREVKDIPQEEIVLGDTTLLYHELPTQGIIYSQLSFDCENIPLSQFQWLALTNSLLLKVGTKDQSFDDLLQDIACETGGIGSTINVFSSAKSSTGYGAHLWIQSKIMKRKSAELVDFFEKIFKKIDFSDKSRIEDLLSSMTSKLRTTLQTNGDRATRSYLGASLSNAGYLGNLISGPEYYDFLKKVQEEFASDPDKVISKLNEMKEQVFQRENLLMNVTSSKKAFDLASQDFAKIPDLLPQGNSFTSNTENVFALESKNTALQAPGGVQYVAKGINLRDIGYENHGSFDLLNQLLSTGYLWERIRVQGGAYGCYLTYDRLSGALILASYRDPNLEKTLDVFNEIHEFLENLEMPENALEKLLLGTFGRLDAPMTNSQKGKLALNRHLTGVKIDEINKYRAELLDSTLNDLKAFAKYFKTLSEDGVVCVHGSAARIAESKNLFDETLTVGE